MTMTKVIWALLATTTVVACGQKQEALPSVADDAPVAASTPLSIYQTAVANTARPPADRARDASRKPAEVLEFFGIEPGMTVLDMFTGGGYYAEILASVVGEHGKVIAQSNDAYVAYVGDAFATRFDNSRLPNVEVLMAENNALALEANTIDAVMLVLSFHDLYLLDPDNGWDRIDVDAFLAELKNGLRPGGIVGVIDHRAEAGASSDSGNDVHRIDPAIVISTMSRAGFELLAESDLLANADDDLTKTVFADGIRGNTDRFVLRFRNAE